MRWALVGALALLLLPAALFPPGGDSALFFESGQKILHDGAVHYRDIVDVKPPLIYHIYALASLVFGSTTASFRILDWLLQLATAVTIAIVVARHRSDRHGAIAAIIYAVTYVAQSYNGTALTESYVGLCAVPMLALQLRRRGFVAIGALAGALFLLKFTLAMPLAVAIAGELLLFDEPIARRVRNVAVMLVGFIVVAATLLLYLSVFGAWQGFGEMNAFLAAYVRDQSPSALGTMREAMSAIAMYFSDGYSLAMLAATIVGVALAMRDAHGTRLLRLAVIGFALMMLGVVIEAKFRGFHFSRLLPYAAILSAEGLVWIIARARAARPLDAFGRIALTLLVVAALVFSPLVRYAWHTTGAVLWTTKGARGADLLYHREILGYSFEELERIGRYVRSAGGGEMFVSSGVAALVYAFSGRVPQARIYHSAFLIAPYAPPSWREETARYLLSERPRFIVVHLRDSMQEMTGTTLSSEGALRSLPGVDAMMLAEYRLAIGGRYFELWERRRAR